MTQRNELKTEPEEGKSELKISPVSKCPDRHIILDMNCFARNYYKHGNLADRLQINRIYSRIDSIGKKLQNDDTLGNWNIIIREFGITDGSCRFIPATTWTWLLDKMQVLCDKYETLKITIGGVAVKEPLTEIELKKVRENYKPLQRQADLENRCYEEEKYRQVHIHYQHVENLLRLGMFGKTAFSIKVKTAVLQKNSPKLISAKPVPWSETKDHITGKLLSDAIYCPPNPEEKENIYGLDVCRGFVLGVTKDTGRQKPFIQIVSSATIPLNIDSIHGEVLIHADSYYLPQYIYCQDNLSQTPPRVFYNNLLTDDDDLVELKPWYPFELQITKLLDQAIGRLPAATFPIWELLNQAKARFLTPTILDFCISLSKKLIVYERKTIESESHYNPDYVLDIYQVLSDALKFIKIDSITSIVNQIYILIDLHSKRVLLENFRRAFVKEEDSSRAYEDLETNITTHIDFLSRSETLISEPIDSSEKQSTEKLIDEILALIKLGKSSPQKINVASSSLKP